MDTSLYRYVIAAAEAGSFSAAARDLYISQPALTKQIGKLEAQLGQKLFVRTRNSFEITASGALFVDYARKIVALEDKLMQTLTIPDSSAEVIHIATSHRGGTYAARHSSMFYQNYSNVVIDMCNLSALGCEQSLEEERTELAICQQASVMGLYVRKRRPKAEQTGCKCLCEKCSANKNDCPIRELRERGVPP